MDYNEAVNGNKSGPCIIPLEIDEETNSLLCETAGFTNTVSKLTHRKKKKDANGTSAAWKVPTNFRGLLRTRTALPERRAIIMGVLACCALLFVLNSLFSVNYLERHKMQDEDPRIHQSSFGGQGTRPHEHHTEEKDLHNLAIPESNVGERVKSFSQENNQNDIGNYWHDPYHSPFASSLYNRSTDELDAEQQEFEDKMEKIKQQWGSWDMVDLFDDTMYGVRQKPDFTGAKYRDLPLSEFPPDAWQVDEEYVGKFLDQAKALIHRVKEGIYAEYGYPTVFSPEGKNLSDEELKKRDEHFQVILDEYKVVQGAAADETTGVKKPGIAYLGLDAWDGLVQKLLHSLITNDRFYVVLAGNGNAAAIGNNFVQSSVISFHYLMEPVFDFLGMKLISRNMANRYGHTTLSALGGADIYGEADIMWYAPDRPESPGQLDLFQKQAILSGERVPVLLSTDSPGRIENDSNGTAWLAFLQPGADMCEMTTAKNVKTLPPACRYVWCKDDKQFSCSWFDSVCWVDRDNVQPPTPQLKQIPRHKQYPGFRTHQLEGRKLSLLLLHALEEAFDRWEAGIEEDGFPLATNYWHVGETYETIRRNVRSYVAKDNETVPACDELFSDFPNVCHVEMHAFTEWTPRVNPDESSLSKALDPKLDYLDFEVETLYPGIDLLPLQWKIPSDQIDVHAIAISTSVPAEPDDDDWAWLDEEDDMVYNVVNGKDNGGGEHNDNGGAPADTATNKTGGRRTTAVGQLYEQNTRRTKTDFFVTTGKGWSVYNKVPGFCDGSAQSTCNRSDKNNCLLENQNDFQSGLLGDALSGWLTLRIPHVKEGIILIRLDSSLLPGINPATKGWKDEQGFNDRRQLSEPKVFSFDFSVNGNVTTLSREELHDVTNGAISGMILLPLLNDNTMSQRKRSEDDKGETVDVAIRIRSPHGRNATLMLTHVYYA